MTVSGRKHISLLMTFAIVLVLALAGCSGSGGGNTASGGGTGAADKPAQGQAGAKEEKKEPAKKNSTFKVFFDFNIDPKGMSLSDNEYITFLQQKTGVRVEIESPGSAAYMDKLNIMMASGNYPDAFMISDRNKLLQYASDGLLVDLKPYLDKYPNVKQYMPADAWLPVTEKGKIWAFPYNRQDGMNQVTYINKQWLDKLGLKVPKTLDEFYVVMKAFTEKDPDGNGKNDTFGLAGNNSLGYGGRMFQAAFDAEAYQVVGGQVLPPEITDNYKDYLKYMARLIKEKIMDPEWPTATTPIFHQKINSGKYGVFSGFWHFKSGKEFAPGVMDPYIAIEPPLKKDGTASAFYYTSTNRHYIAIPKSTKNIEDLLHFFDWVLSPEGTKFVYMGIPDKHYKETNGKFEATKDLPHGIHWAFALVKHGQLSNEVKTYMGLQFTEDVVKNLDLALKVGKIDKLGASLPFFPELSNFSLAKLSDEYRAKTILGNEDVDKSWEDYVKRYKSSGGDQSIKLWTEWYNKEGKDVVK